ncbi:hypothetical protein SYNPS1DRAFT_29069 [Syncephalis pseudoplumigaleata]|uniref:Prokaryotic phospholipase A2-domain-containing protein n=1 Tax=Syncephalis pseudoplumigaleata TaxID=1712513 RepID=A0A4P9Z006_9FUNG|nr:hypothetical protein SYNPS1DRAFT_29069 [Syncephalis pseudoplumigaleata]|eukprot:RKP25192.1 hypothetical protein SYNPS1DRAFT_29069 [Syncephalis pseudoplumigaleata]
MLPFKHAALLLAGVAALLAPSLVSADSASSGSNTGGFNTGATVGSGSASGVGCNIILNDPGYKYLLGCARGNVPQNYTSAGEMESALGVFCDERHKCKEDKITSFLTGLLNSCGKDAATNPQHRAYKMFTDLYTAVPRWQSYCRKDSAKKYCLLQPGKEGKYGPRERSFTCDECGQLRVKTYSDWEARTEKTLGKPMALISRDYEAFAKKCPNIKVTVDDKPTNGSTNATAKDGADKSSGAATKHDAASGSSRLSLLVAVVALLAWKL